MLHFIPLTTLLMFGADWPGPITQFGDWIAGCDNQRSCQAIALQPEDDLDGATLGVKLEATAKAAPEVKLSLAWPDTFGESAKLAIDGRATSFSFDSSGQLQSGNPVELIRMLAQARYAAISGPTAKQYSVSTKGAAAALRWIDAQQQRAGTDKAIIASGSRQMESLPEVLPLPIVDQPPTSPSKPPMISQSALRSVREAHECDNPAVSDPELWRLDQKSSLVLIPCTRAAYQADTVAMVADNKGEIRPAEIVRLSGEPDHILVGAEFDSKDRTLSSTYKGRGVGDCGTDEAFAWDGARFQQVYLAQMPVCRGSPERIVTWRAVIRKR